MIIRSKEAADKTDASDAADTLIQRRIYNAESKKWGKWEVVFRCRRPIATEEVVPSYYEHHLKLGGTLCVYANLLTTTMQQEVTEELKNHATLFREYRIQGTKEPRAHFLLHEDASNHDIDDDSNKSPGYKYGTITMKARPLHLLPHLEYLSYGLNLLCGVCCWNVGVDVVAYRDGRDSIGFHADNDQGEKLVLTVLVTSPLKPRRVIFKRMQKDGEKSKHLRDGDEEIELCLGAGDAYSMDGKVQQSYVHGVPKDDCLGDSDVDRIAIVCRVGTYDEYTKDSGQPVSDLLPRLIVPQTFGQMKCLTEGVTYLRAEINEMGAHRSPQGGISGNKEAGCDAIIVSGARKDGFGHDSFDELLYAADTRVGAGGLLTSMEKRIPIRVFRSSRLDNKYAAESSEKNGSARYRYDGLYRLEGVRYDHGSGIEKEEMPKCLSPPVKGRLYKFQLARIEVGEDLMSNRKSTEEIMEDSIEPGRVLMAAAILLSLKSQGKKRKAVVQPEQTTSKSVLFSSMKGENIVTP